MLPKLLPHQSYSIVTNKFGIFDHTQINDNKMKNSVNGSTVPEIPVRNVTQAFILHILIFLVGDERFN